jgi:hypothetical protein
LNEQRANQRGQGQGRTSFAGKSAGHDEPRFEGAENERNAATPRSEDWMLPNRDHGDKRSRRPENPVSEGNRVS